MKQLNGADRATYEYNAANQLVKRVEDGVEYSYGYDRRGNLIQEQRGEVTTRQYTYDATNHMTLGKNLENGTQTEYGSGARDVSFLPDFLSRTGNELMTYEKGRYNVRAIFGRGCEGGSRDIDWLGAQMAYGYQYDRIQPAQKESGFRFADFGKEVLGGAVTGGLASAAFYGAGKAIRALAGSIRSNNGDSTVEELTISSRNSSRGNPNAVNINGSMAQDLYNMGFKWSGHTHPGIGMNVKVASQGDIFILNSFKQSRSAIYDSSGKFNIFGGS